MRELSETGDNSIFASNETTVHGAQTLKDSSLQHLDSKGRDLITLIIA